MRTIHRGKSYIINYHENKDMLECSKMVFCLLKYYTINKDIDVGVCGDEITSLRYKGVMSYGINVKLIRTIGEIILKHNVIGLNSIKTLTKLCSLAEFGYNKLLEEEAGVMQEEEALKRRDDGIKWYCPVCGNRLRYVTKDDKNWFDFCIGYEKTDGTEWFLCSNYKCNYSDVPLLLFNSALGWNKRAGDNWAIGYIK